MKIETLLKNRTVLSQLFSSAVSALLIIGIIRLDPSNSDSWSLAYASYVVLLVVIRSIFSEPLVYKHAITFTTESIKKAFVFSFIGSIVLSSIFYSFTGNIHFLFLILPSIINVFQDFTRYGLIALDFKRALVVSDLLWLLCASIVLIFLILFPIVFDVSIYILLWSLFGIFSCSHNLIKLRTFKSNKILINHSSFGLLQFSLLLDKIFPRLVNEAQYFLLNIYYMSSIAEYRLANLLMGFSNVLIMSQILTWISDYNYSKVMNLRQVFLVIVIFNLIVASIALGLSEQLISYFIIGLTLASILDLLITKRVIAYRLLGGKHLPMSVTMRLISSLLLLVGFTATLLILPYPWSVVLAAAIGSFLSLLTLKFFND